MLIHAFVPPKTYIQLHDEKHYCEAIIDNYGRIRDAVPSHQELLISLYCSKYNITRKELFAKLYPEASPLHWIAEALNYTVLWYQYVILPLRFTSRQIATLRLLIGHNIIDLSDVSISNEKSLMDLKYADKWDEIESLTEKRLSRTKEAIKKIWRIDMDLKGEVKPCEK